MHITLIDDSVPFDGHTPATRPLGGAEKCFASLASALAKRGHDVHVYNRCRFSIAIDGAQWWRWDEARPLRTDVLIAFRKPELLREVPGAAKRLLWLTQPASLFDSPQTRALLDEFKPALAFIAKAQAEGWTYNPSRIARVIAPGLRYDYLDEAPNDPAGKRAIVTTHPLHGLEAVLDLWTGRIRPELPDAELHVYSAGLARAVEGGGVPEALESVFGKVLAAQQSGGVMIQQPQGDVVMAEAYRRARLHLYPGHAQDMGCFTLMESQACGVPALCRSLGAVRERVIDGQTGYVVPDDDAFVNLALHMLGDEDAFWSMNREARLHQTGRSWSHVAADFEALIAEVV
ncbi:glycosyltransferase [Telmatospirillum sp. J64-1]|uniref:glycosyltransferase n=1 Tax=Telmatospirillum sp. J64-1 TaxID=2502183 RepID=UPI00115F447B|nr:glycosyltransferase [Telmatospirillum sp. J64-1]